MLLHMHFLGNQIWSKLLLQLISFLSTYQMLILMLFKLNYSNLSITINKYAYSFSQIMKLANHHVRQKQLHSNLFIYLKFWAMLNFMYPPLAYWREIAWKNIYLILSSFTYCIFYKISFLQIIDYFRIILEQYY